MKKSVDLDAILAPIPGDNPAGEDLRFHPVYDEIGEARRADDTLARGAWQRDLKKADWGRVSELSVETLVEKSKDLQIAAWLTEALTEMEGFEGLLTGLKTINGFLSNFWEQLYPEIDEGDLDFRAGRIEFLNSNLWQRVKQVALTEPGLTPGYSRLHYEESRRVGYETDASKKNVRAELIAEGKISAEEFDSAVAMSSKSFYVSLAESLRSCREEFAKLDQLVDEKFSGDAPRLAELRTALEECDQLVSKILKEKRRREPDEEPGLVAEAAEEAPPEMAKGVEEFSESSVERAEARDLHPSSQPEAANPLTSIPFLATQVSESTSPEAALWETAMETLKSAGIRNALDQLLTASCRAPSVRERNRYRLLMAKLCLKADRPDLARPIVEQLHQLIEELQLERWESPLWIAEVLDALYQCLTAGEGSDQDKARAQQLFEKLCTIDITRAITYG